MSRDAASVEQTNDSTPCGKCGARTRVNEGICVTCFLREGLTTAGEESAETFGRVLDEFELPDLPRQFGQYEILEGIGRGGMGVIYRARQRHTERIVALKRVLAYQAESSEALLRFRREAEAVARLDHPNILPIYEVGQGEDGLPFYSMKYASGGSLRTTAESWRNRPNDCVKLMARVARAIDYAHGRGILHRDLQPGNILLDDRGEPLVSDFGLAKWLTESSDLTRSLTTFGTPGYIAPEQAESAAGDLTPAADVYGLGAILFHLLAGRPPFVGDNVLSVMRRASLEPAPKLRTLAPSLDRDLETICARCLARDPQARYQSAGDLAEDLDRWLEGRPIVARPVTAPIRLWRWTRRNPILAGAAAACFLLGATVLWLLPGRVATSSAISASEKSVAVLPFQNLSPDQENALFADAVQNELLTNLARVDDLKVISRTSVMPYGTNTTRNLRQIARELGVTHVVEGTVQRVEGRVRVIAQLIDARTDSHLWAETYDRDLSDIFAIETEVSREIAERLRAQLSPKERQAIASQPTRDLKAFESYIRARVLMETPPYASSYLSDLKKAVALFEDAVRRDPHFALAYAALSKGNSYLGHQERKERDFSRAQIALQEAQRLAPDSGETRFAQALLYYYRDLDFERALAELDVAAQSLPNNAEVFLLRGLLDRRLGRWRDSLRDFQRATELNPKDPEAYVDALMSARALRWHGEAYRIADAGLKALPEKADEFRADKGITALMAGDLPAAHRHLESIHNRDNAAVRGFRRFLSLMERDYDEVQRLMPSEPRNAGRQALLAVATNTTEERRSALSALRTSLEEQAAHDPDDHDAQEALPLLDFALGERDKALRRAREAAETWPISKDALRGPGHLNVLAKVYALAGDLDKALEILATLVKVPFGVYYGGLAFDPAWDNLRDDPRFNQLLAEAAKPL